jgi:glycosyltransferase involved in cell wall biosynthesis
VLNISVIILTYNEEKHIERCIRNAQNFSNKIFLVDSYSSDRTVEMAEALGAKVHQNKWENNYARQFNWGLQNLPITTEWVFRLDADEYLSEELIEEIGNKFPKLSSEVSGVIFERKMIFLEKLINKGMIQMNMLRLFKYGYGQCEDRWMDEHIILSKGITAEFQHYFVDHNLNSLGWWTNKHNGYSIREAIDLLDYELNLTENEIENNFLSLDAANKRRKKLKYAKLPLFWRSFYYFMYRYFIKFGFTQGKEGFLWHFLQGWWYRTLVDAKIYEIKKYCGNDVLKIKEYIKDNYHIEL